jgi:WD40 repeat protein
VIIIHITVWEVASPEEAYRSKVAFQLQTAATKLAFSRDGYRLVTGSSSEIILWNLERRHLLITAEFPSDTPSLSMAFSPGGSVLAATHRAGINLWELPEGKELPALPGQPSDWIQTSLAFSPDGKTLIIGDEMFDHNVTLWDLDRGQPIALGLEGHYSAVWSVAFSPIGEIAASGSLDGTIIFWDPKTGLPLSPPLSDRHGYEDLLWKGGEAENAVRSLRFTPDGEVLVTGRRSGDILLWDVAQQQPHGEGWPAHRGGVNAVVVSPDGQVIASAGDDFLVRLWDVETHTLLGELVGHTEPVRDLSFSTDGKLLASGGGLVGDVLRLWDVAAGRALGEVRPELSHNIYSIAFSPHGHILATGSDHVTLWDLSTEMWLQQARQIANRDLTTEERLLYLDDTR